jgi:hypothetical protein
MCFKVQKRFRNKYTHSTPLDQKWCLGVFGAFQKCLACKKMQNMCFRLNALVRGSEVAKTVWHQMHPFYSIGLKITFGSGLEHLQTLDMKEDAKLLFRAWMHYCGLPKVWLWFRIKCIHSTPIDQKWCLGVFWCKTCGSRLIHYFGVQKLRKQFHPKCIHSTPLDSKWCLRMVWSICNPSACKKMQNFYFGLECTSSGYRSTGNGFTWNASIRHH